MSVFVPERRAKTRPPWGRALMDCRGELGKSRPHIERESGGLIYVKLLDRRENGQKHPKTLDLEEFSALLRALEWTAEAFMEATGLELLALRALAAVERLEVRPRWVPLPVYGWVSAGEEDSEPLEGEVAYFPLEGLRAKGADPAFVRAYRVSGDCMVSDEARRAERNIAPGDYVAVDTRRVPRPGDVVVAWWAGEERLVVKRYRIEGAGVVLQPANRAYASLVLEDESDLAVLGVVVARVG